MTQNNWAPINGQIEKVTNPSTTPRLTDQQREQAQKLSAAIKASVLGTTPAAQPPQGEQPLRVTATYEVKNPGDQVATMQLLNATRTADGYKCMLCSFSTSDAETMIHHLAEETNAALAKLPDLTKALFAPRTTPKQAEPQPDVRGIV